MRYRGIVIAGTGLGHVNRKVYPALERACKAGVLVFMTLQTLWGFVQMQVYETGREILGLGVVPLANTLPEVAYVKLGWALGLHPGDDAAVQQLMTSPIALIEPVCEAELARVLAYPFAKGSLDAAAQAAALAQCRRLARRVEVALPPPERARLPQWRDPDDQKFLELAFAAEADILITKDRALLEIARRKKRQVGRTVPFRILTPEEFQER